MTDSFAGVAGFPRRVPLRLAAAAANLLTRWLGPPNARDRSALSPSARPERVVPAALLEAGAPVVADDAGEARPAQPRGAASRFAASESARHRVAVRHYRTIWISDVHLGTRGCKAEFLLDFLRCTESETMYLVGDIVDGWRLKKSWYWPQAHNDVVQKVLRKVRKGTRVVYVPGNHDEWLRDYTRLQFGGVEVVEEAIHVTADGRRLLIIHGDAFDVVVKHARWLALLGDGAYDLALYVNRHFNLMRRRLGYPYWSLSGYLKCRIKNAVQYIGSFATAVADEARRRGVDGIVCGHIHHAEIRDLGGVLYCNDGDWVEGCTALVEHFDGRLELLDWSAIAGLDPLAIGAAARRHEEMPVPAFVEADP